MLIGARGCCCMQSRLLVYDMQATGSEVPLWVFLVTPLGYGKCEISPHVVALYNKVRAVNFCITTHLPICQLPVARNCRLGIQLSLSRIVKASIERALLASRAMKPASMWECATPKWMAPPSPPSAICTSCGRRAMTTPATTRTTTRSQTTLRSSGSRMDLMSQAWMHRQPQQHCSGPRSPQAAIGRLFFTECSDAGH